MIKTKKYTINTEAVFCPKCGTKQSIIRKPQGIKEILWGGYTCKTCACKMDKFGKLR